MNSRAVPIIGCLILVFLAGCHPAAVGTSSRGGRQPRLVDYGETICLDMRNGLMWQSKKSEVFGSWQAARQYAENLDSAGFDDWRLPTYDEFYILSRLLDLKRGGDCQIKLKGSFWTGDTEKKARAGFWDSDPQCGGPSYFFVKSERGAVLAVRLAQVSPEPANQPVIPSK